MTTTNNKRKLGIYAHIPFCIRKCAYCDFLSFEDESAVVHKVYIKALTKEIETNSKVYNNNYIVDSIFIGGGTPSLILPSMIDDVIKAVKHNFNMAIDSEITIEINPKTLSMDKLKSYADSGVNRVSIGAQSFNDYVLKILGRIHLAENILKNFKMLRAAGFKNINIDLIFGVPAQSLNVWKESLDKALELSPEHLSFYGLQVEEGTKLHKMIADRKYKKVDDELDREMYHLAVKELKKAGYKHYEISNAAKNGYECRHNLKYWSLDDYLGAGLGAHSYIDGMRFGNVRDLEKYIEANLENQQESEHLKCQEWSNKNSAEDDISEYMFTGLRRTRGINLVEFESRFKRPLKEVYKKEWPAVEKYIKNKLLILEGESLMLSEKGIDISNRIMSEFILTAGGRI